eukprot:scaffold38463_cov27-Attheya_sp.AAC.1
MHRVMMMNGNVWTDISLTTDCDLNQVAVARHLECQIPLVRNAGFLYVGQLHICRTDGPSKLAQYKCVEMYTRPISGAIPLISTREYMMESPE